MSTKRTFAIGETIVYPLHGNGRVHDIVTQAFGDCQQRCYHLVFDDVEASVLLPVGQAKTYGLRRPLKNRETRRALRQLQQTTARPLQRKQGLRHYTWCKERLRQGDALGLWEVCRFLHDMKSIENFNTPEWRFLQTYVRTQTARELTQALGCAPDVAAELIETALVAQGPVQLPSPDRCASGTC
jgi:CarD family transcriptional regulator